MLCRYLRYPSLALLPSPWGQSINIPGALPVGTAPSKPACASHNDECARKPLFGLNTSPSLHCLPRLCSHTILHSSCSIVPHGCTLISGHFLSRHLHLLAVDIFMNVTSLEVTTISHHRSSLPVRRHLWAISLRLDSNKLPF